MQRPARFRLLRPCSFSPLASLLILAVAAHAGVAPRRYDVTALVLTIDRSDHAFTASCSSIPGYMPAMVMRFPVRDPHLLESIQAGSMINFTLVVESNDSYAENLRPHSSQNFEQEAQRARRLEFLDRLNSSFSSADIIKPGARVPDFTLTDQLGHPITLSQFSGKVVAISFFYTSCPLPNYCLRLSNNLGRVQKRFASTMGTDLVLLSITFDPIHDQPDVLAKYAANWKADPQSWHFLTGPPEKVKSICHRFGVNVWPGGEMITHSLQTVLIDRQGRLFANLEGNEFTAQQLGDLIDTELPSKE